MHKEYRRQLRWDSGWLDHLAAIGDAVTYVLPLACLSPLLSQKYVSHNACN